MQLSAPALTVTLPAGVPLPGASTVTLKVTGTGWPTTDGSGVSAVIVVVVLALLTVWESAADVDPLKLVSPTYVAVNVFVPALVNVRLHVPAATVPLQLSVPSLTVTLPVGVPVPGELTVTL